MSESLQFLSKLPNVGVNIFTEMTKYAQAYDAINLAQGFPDYSSSTELFDLVSKYMYAGKNQYAPMSGLPELKSAIREKYQKVYGIPLGERLDICVTAGATQAIFTTFQAIINRGDEVIYFEPAYDAYVPGIITSGGKPIAIPCEYPEYKIDWSILADSITSKTKMIVINNPGNPSGKIWSEDDFKKLYELIKDKQIFILSDEVYEHLVFDGKKHKSILQFPEFQQRSIAVYSFGKTFHNTGWKVGYAICHNNIYNEFLKVHQFNVFCVHSPSQYAFSEFIENQETYCNLSQFYEAKRDLFLKGLSNSQFKFIPTNGSYFQLVDYSNISDEDDNSFAKLLTREIGVASIPVSSLYTDGRERKLIRFCFAKKDQTLIEASQKLCRI